MRRLTLVVAFLSVLQVGPAARDQSPSSDAQRTSTIYSSRATAILVDVVVRDKKGALITNLGQDDFEVLEDNVPQKVGSFSIVNHGGGIGIGVKFKQPGGTTVLNPTDAASGTSAPAQPVEPAVTALIFDALSPDALSITQRAALSYVPMNGESEARIAVFETEPALKIMQSYTSDLAMVRKGIREVTATGTAAKELKTEQKQQLSEKMTALDSQTERLNGLATSGGGEALGQSSTAIGQLEMEQRLAEGQKRMIDAFETLDRDHRGYATTNALMAVLRSMSDIGGRKTIVMFSEGLPASPAMRTQLQTIIETANRSNISIYTVDANGLRATSTLQDTRTEVQDTAQERLRQISLGRDTVNGPYTRAMERTEDLLALDPQGGLATLANDTGGFLVHDTNDISTAFKRIDEDSRFHYLLSYSPSNTALDGKFRTIQVRVRRPGTEVFSRKGYRAIRGGEAPSLGYEVPALALLDQGGLPNAFPIHAGGLVFPERHGGALVPVIVKVNTSTLRFETDQARGTYNGQVAVVVRIKDQSGRVVQKLSQQYVLSGEMKDVEAAKNGEILFYRQPLLGPGFFQIESAVYDMVAQRGSARVSTLTVPPPSAEALEMSSLVIVGKTERVPGTEARKGAPLYYDDVLMYPNLGDPVSRTADKEVAFYVSLYPATGRPVQLVMLELLHNGQRIANTSLPVGTVREDRIQNVGRLPLDGVPPGTYELKVTASDGQTERSRSTFFTVAS
jgi:VWFA-related protein